MIVLYIKVCGSAMIKNHKRKDHDYITVDGRINWYKKARKEGYGWHWYIEDPYCRKYLPTRKHPKYDFVYRPPVRGGIFELCFTDGWSWRKHYTWYQKFWYWLHNMFN